MHARSPFKLSGTVAMEEAPAPAYSSKSSSSSSSSSS
eukprot:CAMPEP_0205905272 /NCGR_PEP_ID=MMETSP1325-20131115/1252_1 /ASSEMBLY_ACC=CAM_ASM_000708 /TAXON_ID=236786 /ORGANISM="Florenciella sp., Strain RCC1007" /LENGTH=36 /DNA_ID= /DNA_START= /DNA_END= /DNA_ORIENTATION=